MAMSGERAGWEHFGHEADIGVRGFGPTREAAFEQGAVALMHAIADPDRVEPREAIEIACDAPDDALLFVDSLNALIFEVAIEVKGATYTDLKVGPRPGGGWLAQCVVDV